VTHLAVKDRLLDAQTLRTAGSALFGGADVGECIVTAQRVKGSNLNSWYDEWSATAQTVMAMAEVEELAGHVESARLAYFRSANYSRNAGVMLLGTPVDSRLIESYTRQRDAFRRGAALLEFPPDVVMIPFEATTLPGYFFRVDRDPRPRATVILTGGYDGTAEELYFMNGAAALRRGYNVLAFDGPGQGAALLQQGITLRPDWENVIGPVLDFAVSRADVDPKRVAIIGLSLGAHLAPRAASVEHRLAACIADCGSFDLFNDAAQRIPRFLRAGFVDGRTWATKFVGRILDLLAAKPTAGWALRRGQLVHGASTPLGYLQSLRDYSLKDHAAAIQCPTFVCNAQGDDISASAPRLVEALTCPHVFSTFTSAEGAGDHCEAGGRTLFHLRAFGWLDQILHPVD
jgi:alpha-beta hydrolase superfamily lysophospholipase